MGVNDGKDVRVEIKIKKVMFSCGRQVVGIRRS